MDLRITCIRVVAIIYLLYIFISSLPTHVHQHSCDNVIHIIVW